MRTRLASVWLGLCLCACVTLASAGIVLDTAGASREVGAQATWWFDSQAKASIQTITAAADAPVFAPSPEGTTYRLSERNRLWVKLDVQRSAAAPAQWLLSVPLPFIDKVTLYQPTVHGGYAAQSAGDRIAVEKWPERARYPMFRVSLPAGTQTLYLQIQGSTPVNLPIVLASEAQANSDTQVSYMGLGAVCGALALLAIVCGLQGYAYRDRVYALYGAYLLLVIVAIACYNGLAAQYLWDLSPGWADASQAIMGALTMGVAIFFVRHIIGVSAYSRRWSLGLLALSAMGLGVAAGFDMVPRETGVAVLAVYVTACSFFVLWAALNTWRRGDRIGLWVAAAYVPLAAMALIISARAMGWASMSWVVQWGLVAALLLQAPLLMAALHLRSRERHNAQNRQQAMFTHDALTGLLSVHMFEDRLRQTILRARRHREDAAVVLVQLVNYPQIVDSHGIRVAEQCLLHCVGKLRRVLRDIDTVARVSESHFGLILEGIAARKPVTQAAARLIALGLMPTEGIKGDVTLQFHVAGVVLHEYLDDPSEITAKLQALLGSMSRRTRRPIRFLEQPETAVMPLESMDNSRFEPSAINESAHSTNPTSLHTMA